MNIHAHTERVIGREGGGREREHEGERERERERETALYSQKT